MLVRCMVYDKVEDDLETMFVAVINKGLAVLQGSVGWVDVFEVGDIVAHVDLRGGIVW